MNYYTCDSCHYIFQSDDVPAASLLLLFRLNDVDRILGKTLNLTNIRIVKLDQVIKSPGEDYLRFLMDWYYSVTH